METVDARGLSCPLPLALAKRRMAVLAPGDQLLVLTTDPEAPIDFAAWAADDGHELEQHPRPAHLELRMRKARGDRSA